VDGDLYAEGDPEEVNTDKEADYRYTDNCKSEYGDSKDEEGNNNEEDDI
jgi:hypothetical protein